MEHIIERILEYVEPDCEITADSKLRQDCGLTSFDTVSLFGALCREYGVPDDLPEIRRAKTVGELYEALENAKKNG